MAKKEVVKAKSNEVGEVMDYAFMGASDNVDNEDILIPKILLMQQMSDLVQDDKAKSGQYCDSVEGNLLADKGANLDMIVFDSIKLWQHFKMVGGKPEYVSTYKMPLSRPRLILSALRGGGGKTTLSLAVTATWRSRGLRVVPFKKGPDYIDAGWLERAAGLPCRHLDPFLMKTAEMSRTFLPRIAQSHIGAPI